MTIHWELIPLIVFIVLALIAILIEQDKKPGVFSFLAEIAGIISVFIYIMLATFWLCSNIKII